MRCTSIQCVHLLNEQKTTLHLLGGRRVQENSRNCLLTEMSVQRDLPYILRYAWRMSNMSISERDTIMRISVRSLVPIPCTQQTLFQLSLNSSNVELIHQLTSPPPKLHGLRMKCLTFMALWSLSAKQAGVSLMHFTADKTFQVWQVQIFPMQTSSITNTKTVQ